jgi:hypothetical protein
MEPVFDCRVHNNMKAYEFLKFSGDELKANQIADVETIELSFHIYGANDLKTILFTESTVIDLKNSGIKEIEEKTVTEPPQSVNQANNTVAEQVLLDQKNVRVVLKGFGEDYYETFWKIYIENDRREDIRVDTENLTVNGVMIDSFLYELVPSGKKFNAELPFDPYELEKAKIDVIKEVSFKLRVINPESLDPIVDFKDIYIEGNSDIEYTQTHDDSGKEIFNQDGFRIVAKNLKVDEKYGGADLYLYIENNGGSDVSIKCGDAFVNGIKVYTLFSCDILKNTKAYDRIALTSSELKSFGTTDIEKIELSFNIYSLEEWDTILETEQITITFPLEF